MINARISSILLLAGDALDDTGKKQVEIRGALSAALPLISRLTVVGAIAGTALALYGTNTLGARDAVNNFGRTIGQQISYLTNLLVNY